MRTFLIVFLGSGLGGAARHALNTLITRLAGYDFPLGILVVNVLGCFTMGIVVGWLTLRSDVPSDTRLFLTAGLIGGFTTFSAFSLDAVMLYTRGQIQEAAIYVASSVILSILGLAGGLALLRNL